MLRSRASVSRIPTTAASTAVAAEPALSSIWLTGLAGSSSSAPEPARSAGTGGAEQIQSLAQRDMP